MGYFIQPQHTEPETTHGFEGPIVGFGLPAAVEALGFIDWLGLDQEDFVEQARKILGRRKKQAEDQKEE